MVGFLKIVLEVQNGVLLRNMLTELVETVNTSFLANHSRCPCYDIMHRIENEAVSWADTHFLMENRLAYSQTAVFNGSVTMSR